MLQRRDLASVQPSLRCCFEIVLVCLQAVYQHPTVQPTHCYAWEDCFRRLIGLADSSLSLRLLALLANLEPGVVLRLNGPLRRLLGPVKVCRPPSEHLRLRGVLLLTDRQVD